MKLRIEDIIAAATEDERQILANILGCWSSSPEKLVKSFQKRSLNIFQRLWGSIRTYEEFLAKVAEAHGVQRVWFETDEDLERRLVRSVWKRVQSAMTPGQRETYLREIQSAGNAQDGRSLVPQAVGAGGIALAQASGFGIYQMSSSVVGALTAAVGAKLPFIAYMSMSKAISIAIGPIGWLGLGASTLHTLTKPNYNRLVTSIALVSSIRQRINPGWECRGYSRTEIVRKTLKGLVCLTCILLLIWVASSR